MSDQSQETNPTPPVDGEVAEPAKEMEPQENATEATDTPPAAPATTGEAKTSEAPKEGGPISLARIRELRKSQQTAQAKAPRPKPGQSESAPKAKDKASGPGKGGKPSGTSEKAEKSKGEEIGVIKTPPAVAPKVEVPSTRQALSADMESEIDAVLAGGDLDALLVGDSMLQVGHELNEGQRVQGKVIKAEEEFVFVSLGGPNEGIVPTLQFEEAPAAGAAMEVVVRGYIAQEGLYELTLPGNAVEVSDWADISEGEVIEVLITGSNTGGLECKVGSVRGFIPASQVAEYRVENLADMVDQKVLCVVTEANERRGNLVLSRRAVLEREKREKRAERLEAISVGDAVDGTVTKLMDFGAFVDIGGLEGLLHISQLSWERIKHPSEILEEGQKIQVRIDKIDEQSGKIGLSYRSLQEHPWEKVDSQFPVGALIKGTVTRIAEFGAFVKVATGVEGLVHLSELAHHRVHKVANVVSEGEEVEVKVLSTDVENQRMSLSLKAAKAAPEPSADGSDTEAEETPPAKPVLPKHAGPLKGGTGRNTGGDQFGLKW